MKVHQCINEVAKKLAVEGISKDRKNTQQGYQFRGIDDVYNAIAPILAEVGLIIVPSYTQRDVVERRTQKDTALFYVTVCGSYKLISAHDGSEVEAGPFFGEAMDSADKATNKAMSAAYKYMAMQVFAIPTEGDNDADATTHVVKAKITPAGGVLESLEPNLQQKIRDLAAEIQEAYDKAGVAESHKILMDSEGYSADEKVALWSLLGSSCRSALKKFISEQRKAA